jgi:hypothetical protein
MALCLGQSAPMPTPDALQSRLTNPVAAVYNRTYDHDQQQDLDHSIVPSS